jgi:hypothetical protein
MAIHQYLSLKNIDMSADAILLLFYFSPIHVIHDISEELYRVEIHCTQMVVCGIVPEVGKQNNNLWDAMEICKKILFI